MTPYEFSLAVTAAREEKEDLQYLEAWGVSNLMNCWVKKGARITADKLLGRRSKKSTVSTPEQAAKHNRSLLEAKEAEEEKARANSWKRGDRWQS